MRSNFFTFAVLVIVISLLAVTFLPAQASSSSTVQSPTQEEITPPEVNPQAAAAANRLYLPSILNLVNNRSIFGVEVNTTINNRRIDLLNKAGVNWLRRNGVVWSQVEKVKGVRDWSVLSALEQDLVNASQQNMEVILIVRGTPEWARKYSASPCGPIKPEELDSFASFLGDLVRRYSQEPYSIEYWEIGNEPDAFVMTDQIPYGCWGEPQDEYYGGGYYAEMLKRVTPQIRSADPNAKVLLGGLLLDCNPNNPPEYPFGTGQKKDCSSSRFLEGVLRNGGAAHFDGVSFHAYDYYSPSGMFGNYNWHSASNTTGPTILAKTRFIKDVLAAYNASDKFLMNTELSLICSDGCGADFEQTKANLLIQSYVFAKKENLQASIWYDLYGNWRNSGLLGDASVPLPAYYAFQAAKAKLGPARYKQHLTQGPVQIHEFSAGSRRIWVMWSLEGTHTYSLPFQPLAVSDRQGSPQAASSSISIGANPVFVEWAP